MNPLKNNTTIVIPCYNEAERIDLPAFLEFTQQQQGVDFLFVNDGSTDGTLDLIKNFVKRHPSRLSLLNMPANGGKAEAVRCGILQALDTDSDYVGFLDADLATPLAEISRFMQVMHENPTKQMIIGSRIPLLGHQINRTPLRRFIGRGFASVASKILGIPLFDTQCGAKFFKVNTLTRFLFETQFSSRWIFDVELFARLSSALGKQESILAIYELPLNQWTEIPGSKLRSRDFLKAIGELLAIHFEFNMSRKWTTEIVFEDEPATISLPKPDKQNIAA
ncbi:MAG: glycosyltransferase [Pirellulales bacterium]|jgi:dolichyl-phosphate beta-glucosyltransferase